jgi:hypothetical protein
MVDLIWVQLGQVLSANLNAATRRMIYLKAIVSIWLKLLIEHWEYKYDGSRYRERKNFFAMGWLTLEIISLSILDHYPEPPFIRYSTIS